LLANIVHIVEIDAFIFGGSVALNNKELLVNVVKDKFEEKIFDVIKGKKEFLLAELEDDAGLIGAAVLVKQS